MSNVIIRVFTEADRACVRHICCDAASRGEPIEQLFFDREMAADLLTKYYTDYEPRSTFVAICEGKVVGYVQGCLDNRRYGLVMFWLLVPKTFLKGFRRGVFFRKEIWRFALGMARNWRRLFLWRKESFHSHQGHMHIAVAKYFRARHLGHELIAVFLNYAKEQGVTELTASVHSGNTAARGFFESFGFQDRGHYPMVMAGKGGLERYESIFYVKTIN